MNTTIGRSFSGAKCESIATRTHRTDSSSRRSSSGTTTEQVSTLHNATAYVEGIHFGSCFRHVNTHAPHNISILRNSTEQYNQKKKREKERRKIVSFEIYKFFGFLLFSSFATSSTVSSSSYLSDCKYKSKSVPFWTCDDKVVSSRT